MKIINEFRIEPKTKRSLWKLFLLTLLSFFVLWFFSNKYARENTGEYASTQIQQVLLKKIAKFNTIVSSNQIEDNLSNISLEKLNKIKEDVSCELFLIRGDSIKYWSTNLVAIENIENFSEPIVKLNNGWYYLCVVSNLNTKLICLIPLKSEYEYSNEFLPEEFNSEFRVNKNFSISLEKGDYNIWDSNDNFLFSIYRDGIDQILNSQAYILFLLFVLFLFLVLFLSKEVYAVVFSNFQKKWMIPLFILGDILIIWGLIQILQAPRVLFNSFLFQKDTFGDHFHYSIGNYFINVVLILYGVYLLFYKKLLINQIFRKSSLSMTWIAFLITIFGLILFENSIIDLFKYSPLSFQFGRDFIVSPGVSFLTFMTLCLISYAVFLLIQALVIELKKLNLSNINLINVSSIAFSILIISSYLLSDTLVYTSLLFALLFFSMYFMDFSKLSAIQFVLYLSIFSIYMSVVSSDILLQKEFDDREILAKNLVGSQDDLAEMKFLDIEKNIYNSPVILKELKQPLTDSIENIIIENVEAMFRTEYWKRYTPYVTICDKSKILDIQPEGYLIGCSDYFENFINDFAIGDLSRSLIKIKSTNLNKSYITRFNFDTDSNGRIDISIFVELISELIPEGVGYTELFNDASYEIKGNDIINYSFAKYENDLLIYKFGAFSYDMDFSSYKGYIGNFESFYSGLHNHLVYRYGNNNTLIISRPIRTFWEQVAPFSYFFIFFSVFVLLISLTSNFSLHFFKAPLSFKKRIQFSFTSIILFSFLVIGSVTLFYLMEVHDNKNREILNEKAHSVLVELEHKLAQEDDLPVEMTEYLNSLLNKFSLVFFSDINLYDLTGKMIASSRPRIINEGLISPLIHPKAYQELTKNERLLFIQDESIGNYKYLSAYLPFRNSENRLIAYLNLPYFARQSEIQKEITTFLVALVNIYLLFFVIAIIITLIISRNISRPLELIRNSIAQLRLGGANEKIDWQREDEIGSLIIEYNRMIDELGRSAELLAKSERESAWREMAKQVAHEIKNPLTPMKLSVQYLKKMWDEKVTNWNEHLNRFSTTIIQQIDTLSEIATAFSDFAKMPKTKAEAVDLKDVIQKSIGLFKENHLLNIRLKVEEKNYMVLGDGNQLLRVFNNLIKNSIQAIGERKSGRVSITITEKEKTYLVSIEDNGIGIQKEQAEKIFSPSFTTKSSGMGLGLSIVKSIVMETGGKIWFESEEKKGTTFYIELPIYGVE